jgi:uroporphyrinogen III methyltransferase/synthase
MNAPGVVHLVGAGPWALGLLTIRGRQLLGRADVVVYDYLANPELLRHCPQAETILVGEGPHRKTQSEINALLVELGLAGRVVVRLKGGDPFVFGRGGEEAEALALAGVPFEVVPGVTAAIAGAAYAGIPVTHRSFGPTLTLVTGHGKADQDPIAGVDWPAVARMSTVALYMAARNLPAIASALIAAGRAPETPVAMVRWATRVDQQTVVSTLGQAAADAERAGLAAPLTVVIGEVVRLRETIGWFERRALHGLRIAVTRSAGQQGPLLERLDELGAECISLPTIDFAAPSDPTPLVAALGRLDTYDWVIFTSANGVDFALDALRASGRDPRAFGRARIACIGPATARRLTERGLLADRVPETFVAEALLAQFVADGTVGRRYLLLRAEVAREVLPDELRAAGGEVDVVVAYRTRAAEADPESLARIRRGEVDVLTFTASSTVRHFCELVGPEAVAALQARVPAVCIGPVTAETARAAGFRVAATPDAFTIPGLVDALVAWRGGQPA